MARFFNWLFGGLMVWFALEAWFLPIIPDDFLSYLVIALGAVILFTPVGRGPFIRTTWSQKATRILAGVFSIASGLASIVGDFGQYVPQITLYSSTGPIIMAVIGAIYLLSGTATGNYEIRAS